MRTRRPWPHAPAPGTAIGQVGATTYLFLAVAEGLNTCQSLHRLGGGGSSYPSRRCALCHALHAFPASATLASPCPLFTRPGPLSTACHRRELERLGKHHGRLQRVHRAEAVGICYLHPHSALLALPAPQHVRTASHAICCARCELCLQSSGQRRHCSTPQGRPKAVGTFNGNIPPEKQLARLSSAGPGSKEPLVLGAARCPATWRPSCPAPRPALEWCQGQCMLPVAPGRVRRVLPVVLCAYLGCIIFFLGERLQLLFWEGSSKLIEPESRSWCLAQQQRQTSACLDTPLRPPSQ